MKKDKKEEKVQEDKVDDVSIKKGILKENVQIKEKKKMNKYWKFLLIFLLIIFVFISCHMIKNHLIINDLIKKSKVMENYTNYSSSWTSVSGNGMTYFKSSCKDGNFIEYYSADFIEDDGNLLKNYNSLFKGSKNSDGKYDVTQYYSDNTYEEYVTEMPIAMSLTGAATVQIFDDYPTLTYLKMLLTTMISSTSPDGINCYEFKDITSLNSSLYINKETGLSYKSIYNSNSKDEDSMTSIIKFEIGNVKDEDLIVPNIEQYVKKEATTTENTVSTENIETTIK